jgi:hypothetical protein
MLLISKSVVAALMLGTGLFAAGCQSSGNAPAAGGATPANEPVALACSKCETTYKKVVVTSGAPGRGPNIVRYRTVADHECPDCRNVVKTWFSQGKTAMPGTVVHTCKACGGEVKVCHAEKM